MKYIVTNQQIKFSVFFFYENNVKLNLLFGVGYDIENTVLEQPYEN